MNSQKILTILVGIVGVIAMFFLIRIIGVGDEAIKAGESGGTVNTFMYIAYFILAITLAFSCYFYVKKRIFKYSNIKKHVNGSRCICAFGTDMLFRIS